jgi:hypothetical protein
VVGVTRYGDWACTDRDDTRDDVNPDVSELCNGIDDNCDVQPDDTVLVGAYGADDGGRYSGVACLVLGPISGTVQPSRTDGT